MKKSIEGIKEYIKVFLKWTVVAVFVGFICGVAGVIFHHAIELATEYRTEYKQLILLVPVYGLIITFLYNKSNMQGDSGTNGIFNAVRNGTNVKTRLAPLIFVGTVLTHLGGGSSGREGAALQMGGSIGATVARLFKMKENDLKVTIICGMSGVFSALFATPITAAIFCLEVINVGIFQYSALLPALFSALTAYAFAVFTGVKPTLFALPNAPASFDIINLAKVIALGALCAVVAILICEFMHTAAKLYKKYMPNPYIRVAVGGVLIILFTFFDGTGNYNGAGFNLAAKAIEGQVIIPWAFLFKLLLTGITLGAGFKGGEIVPTLCIGATFGSVAGTVIGLDPGFAAAIGMIAVFCGATNGPIASIFLAMEFFGGVGILYFAAACGVSYMLSGRFSLYSAQKFVYAKLTPDLLDDKFV